VIAGKTSLGTEGHSGRISKTLSNYITAPRDKGGLRIMAEGHNDQQPFLYVKLSIMRVKSRKQANKESPGPFSLNRLQKRIH
jgi:hypothetical protein